MPGLRDTVKIRYTPCQWVLCMSAGAWVSSGQRDQRRISALLGIRTMTKGHRMIGMELWPW